MAFRRRGAPFTFDAEAFVEAVKSLQSCFVTRKEDPRLALRFPSFDHAIQDPVQDDIYVMSVHGTRQSPCLTRSMSSNLEAMVGY
jgi:pantothenate kinase